MEGFDTPHECGRYTSEITPEILPLGLRAGRAILAGGRELPPPVSLPASALGTFVRMTAAAMLAYRDVGLPGLKLVGGPVDFP